MPKRTNEFQQLVTLIHKAIAPQNATVTESAMVRAPGFGELREIDVLLESHIGPYHMKIAIEAKDHKRKLNITDIETIVGKYRVGGGLVVDKVVLVSRRGFSNQATAKARLNGIELLTLCEAKNVDWQKYLPDDFHTTPQDLAVDIKPHAANLQLDPLGKQRFPSGDIMGGRIVCKCHGHDHGTPGQYAMHVMHHHLFSDVQFRNKFNAELKSRQRICVRVGWPMAQFLLSLNGVDTELAQLRFHIHATHAVAPVTFKSYELEGDSIKKRMIQHGTADVAGQRVQLVMPDGLESKKIFLQFGDCNK